MTFCTGCGKELQANAQFCPSCGKKAEPSAVQVTTSAVQIKKEPSKDLGNIILAVVALLGLGVLISLALNFMLGVIIDAALAAAAYLYGYKKLEVQDYKTVNTVLLVIGVLGGFGFGLTVVAGAWGVALMNLALVGLCYYGCKQIKTITGK